MRDRGRASYHARRLTCTGAPRARSSNRAALAPLAAISRWSVLPKSAQTSPGDASAYVDTTRGTWRAPIAIVSRPSAHRVERPAVDVGDEVAEAIDAEHFAVDSASASTEGRGMSSCCSGPEGRPSAVSSIPSASHAAAGAKRSRPSNVRLTLGRANRRSVSSTTRLGGLSGRRDRQHAVVGRDERVVAGVGGDAAPRRADAGVHDDQKDRARRKVPVRRCQLERAGENVVRRNVVRDVHQRRVRADAEHHALHRADVVIAQAEVGQRDDRARHDPELGCQLARDASPSSHRECPRDAPAWQGVTTENTGSI